LSKIFGDFHDHYVKTDDLLSADVLENFRNTCIQSYEIDPAFSYTFLGLFWSAMVYKSKIELDLFAEIDMHLFIE